mmetsp:Transcript_27744/g.64547  ORF Transcript_27744/g.64547 Transcript_27744/m.64547 type:complete len:258 (-) Transcript_27744:1078-1851(-)
MRTAGLDTLNNLHQTRLGSECARDVRLRNSCLCLPWDRGERRHPSCSTRTVPSDPPGFSQTPSTDTGTLAPPALIPRHLPAACCPPPSLSCTQQTSQTHPTPRRLAPPAPPPPQAPCARESHRPRATAVPPLCPCSRRAQPSPPAHARRPSGTHAAPHSCLPPSTLSIDQAGGFPPSLHPSKRHERLSAKAQCVDRATTRHFLPLDREGKNGAASLPLKYSIGILVCCRPPTEFLRSTKKLFLEENPSRTRHNGSPS